MDPLPALFRLAALALAPLLLLAGCASVGVSPGTAQDPGAGGNRPLRLVIVPFDFHRCALNVDREGVELVAFKEALADALAADIALRAPPLGMKADVARKPPVEAEAAWLVRGSFTRVNQGSRAARAVVGFGMGGTKMETRVEVYDLASASLRPLFTFETSGGSGASPGAVISSNPYSFAASLAVGSISGVSDDQERTARMVVSYLAEQLAARGWLPSSAKVDGAKRLDDEDTRKLQGDDAPSTAFDDDSTGATAARARKTGARSK